MSRYFEWLESFSVGVPEIDEDHKVLVSLVNDLVTAIQERHGRDVLNDILIRLVEYTAHHFDREERIMKEHGFPELGVHTKQHNRLIRHVLRYMLLFRRDALEPVELGEFLIDWLTTHILREDMKIAAHIRLQSVA